MSNTVEGVRINKGLWEENCLYVEVGTDKKTFFFFKKQLSQEYAS